MDFDATMVDLHTQGLWRDGAEKLAQHVRPDFQCYIAECLNRGIFVTIATFSMQKTLISEVLKASIPHSQAGHIPVFGGNDIMPGLGQGKRSQLVLSLKYANSKSDTPLTQTNALLVDDDSTNTRLALDDGYWTIQYYDSQKMPIYECGIFKA